MNWITRTGQRWKLRVARACLPVGAVGVAFIWANRVTQNYPAWLLLAAPALGLLGEWLFGALIVCGVCGYRPYLHKPIVTGYKLLSLADCPVCAGGRETRGSPGVYWTVTKIVLVLAALIFFLWYLPDMLLRRGVG